MKCLYASGATKRSSDRTENGKFTNVTNRRSRLGLTTPFYTNRLSAKVCNSRSTGSRESSHFVCDTRFRKHFKHTLHIASFYFNKSPMMLKASKSRVEIFDRNRKSALKVLAIIPTTSYCTCCSVFTIN